MAFLDDAGLVQVWQNISARLSNKMDIIPGKVLSSNDFTDELKAKLDSLEKAAQSDWAASEGEEGYIENRTHWEEVKKVYLCQNVSCPAGNRGSSSDFKLNQGYGKTLVCVKNGVIYPSLTVEWEYDTNTSTSSYILTLNDGSILYTDRISGRGYSGYSGFVEDSVISIYYETSTIHQLDEKYIPSTIARTADIPNLSNVATTSYVDTKVAELVDSSPDTLNTLNELAAALGDDPNFATTIATQIGELEESKVEKIAGKGLSTNDYTTADKTLLNTIADQYLTRDDIADLDSKIEAAHSHAVTYKGSAFANGLYKITTNAEGHVTGATAVAKADITALGIPAQDTDTGATSVEVTGAGNAITAASYDAASRKLTLTKGATYTNNQGTITGVNAGTSLSGGGTSGAISISHAEGSAINKTVGLYKFATDATSHVKSVTAVNKADIVALGIPAQDTTYSAITNDEIDAICGQVIASISEVSW